MIESEKTREREFSPFYKISDNFPNYLITMDDIDMSNKGFNHLNLIDFLLGISDV